MKQAGGGASILVVDDTVENLQLLGSMLSEQGYEVRPVTNGRDALLAARSYPPDSILLDVSMPEMDGYEVCTQLKASEELREIPVIFLTALNSTADKVKAFEVGGADHVTKPFQIDEVLARIRVHIALRRSRQELLASYERLRGLERLREDMVQMVVHDMRSPLSALIGLLEPDPDRSDVHARRGHRAGPRVRGPGGREHQPPRQRRARRQPTRGREVAARPATERPRADLP